MVLTQAIIAEIVEHTPGIEYDVRAYVHDELRELAAFSAYLIRSLE